MLPIALFILGAFVLTGCGGGTGPHPTLEDALHAYTKAVQPTPNYSLPPTFSHGILDNFTDTVTLGADVAPRERLPIITVTDEFTYYMGASRDGVGRHRLESYFYDLSTEDGTNRFSRDGQYPFRVRPRIVLQTDFWNALNRQNDPGAQAAWQIIYEAVQILNEALPPEFQIDPYPQGRFTGQEEGTILMHYQAERALRTSCGAGALACAVSNQTRLYGQTRDGYTRRADIYLPQGGLTLDTPQTSTTLVVHELLHALGISGHVDSIEFPDSLMGTYGEFFPNPGYILHRIDREALQSMYMSQRPQHYNTLREWTDTTLHLIGQSNDGIVTYGVALFNGLPQPWTAGPQPKMLLTDVPPYLQGTVTWSGGLLGFSGVSPIAGDVALHVDLDNLTDDHDLQFRDLFFLNRWEDTTEARWFSTRNLDYDVELTGNWFSAYSEDGAVIGTFVGEEHEGMTGTLRRTDLIGAFGGVRSITSPLPNP